MKNVENRDILIVEDADELRKQLIAYFSVNNRVYGAESLAKARELIVHRQYDIILLDLILPDGSGLALFEDLFTETPVVILSDLGSDENILKGFDTGAVDYITKPASPKIIEARMALRLLPEQEAVLSLGGMKVDMSKRTAFYLDRPIDLTPSEFNIMLFLMQNAGTFFSAAEIYEHVWRMASLNTQTIRIHLHNLRKKLMNVCDECGELIVTEFGKGYAFRKEVRP